MVVVVYVIYIFNRKMYNKTSTKASKLHRIVIQIKSIDLIAAYILHIINRHSGLVIFNKLLYMQPNENHATVRHTNYSEIFSMKVSVLNYYPTFHLFTSQIKELTDFCRIHWLY